LTALLKIFKHNDGNNDYDLVTFKDCQDLLPSKSKLFKALVSSFWELSNGYFSTNGHADYTDIQLPTRQHLPIGISNEGSVLHCLSL